MLWPSETREEAADSAFSLIVSRQNTAPRRLEEPGPSPEVMERILMAAATAPDHGLVRPWRLILVPLEKRGALADVFGLSLTDRDAGATQEEVESAREKAYRSPCLILVVAKLGVCEPKISDSERLVSVGCAIQNMLLMAHSHCFGSGLTSGRAMRSPRMRLLFGLMEGEEALCFVSIGTLIERKPCRIRPTPKDFVSSL